MVAPFGWRATVAEPVAEALQRQRGPLGGVADPPQRLFDVQQVHPMPLRGRWVRLHLLEQVGESQVPQFIRERLERLTMMIRMLEDLEWRLPSAESARVLNALAYFAEPDDLIPDEIPGLGFLDDAIMIELVVRELRHEIEASVGAAVKLETRVDPDLLGGLVVKVGSRMIDASLKTKLNRLKTVMKEA